MTKFNLYEELKKIGFTETKNQFGFDVLVKGVGEFRSCGWYGGEYFAQFKVEAHFNPDRTVVTIRYFDGGKGHFKVKTHMSNKQAFNAMIETAKYHGFDKLILNLGAEK